MFCNVQRSVGCASDSLFCERDFVMLSKDLCISMIRRKYEEIGRLPKKSDFSDEEVARIKSFFGTWPRALEAAGVKEPKSVTKKQKREQKKILQKRSRNAERKIMKKQNMAEKKGKEEE